MYSYWFVFVIFGDASQVVSHSVTQSAQCFPYVEGVTQFTGDEIYQVGGVAVEVVLDVVVVVLDVEMCVGCDVWANSAWFSTGVGARWFQGACGVGVVCEFCSHKDVS